MAQVDRDRLVALRQAAERTITQKQAGEELGLSVRQVKRLVRELKRRGERGDGDSVAGCVSGVWTDAGVGVRTVRQWMMRKKLWLGKKEKEVHLWRPRRSRCGEFDRRQLTFYVKI